MTTINNAKIRCPKCSKVYSINQDKTNSAGKRTARCFACDTRFFVEFKECFNKAEDGLSGVTFLRSYFEKRTGLTRRNKLERRKEIQSYDLVLNSLPNDIIPIFNNDGNAIIGHISPGRREGRDRRSGLDRRGSIDQRASA
jgi:transcription elongation factor Elf1